MEKKSKHRCKCYSVESSSFLYGLRREGPSTERVVLERLLNVLSRAAATNNKNPQRLWAKSEQPEWWEHCTKLQWKNPREHPKDKKDTLRQKIAILERELKQRGLITPAMEEELELWRNSKKSDLELKSDFEAVIAKASGLHYMVDQVFAKIDKARVLTDKIAQFIRETNVCLEACVKKLNKMFERVQLREERKQSLWEKHGVSKTDLIRPSSDDTLLHIAHAASLWENAIDFHYEMHAPHHFLSPSESSISDLNSPSPPTAQSTHGLIIDEGNQQVRVLQRSFSEPDPTAPGYMISSPCLLEKPKSVSAASLTPSVLETICLTDLAQRLQANVTSKPRPSSHGRQASQGPSLANLIESVHEEVAEESGSVQHRRLVSFDTVPVEVPTAHSRDESGHTGKRPRDPEDQEVETRRQKGYRSLSRPKSWGGDMFLSRSAGVAASFDAIFSAGRPNSSTTRIGTPADTLTASNLRSASAGRSIYYTDVTQSDEDQRNAIAATADSTTESGEIEDGSKFSFAELSSMEIINVIRGAIPSIPVGDASLHTSWSSETANMEDREMGELEQHILTLSCENLTDQALFCHGDRLSTTVSFTDECPRHEVTSQPRLLGGSPQSTRRTSGTGTPVRNTKQRLLAEPKESLSDAIGKFSVF